MSTEKQNTVGTYLKSSHNFDKEEIAYPDRIEFLAKLNDNHRQLQQDKDESIKLYDPSYMENINNLSEEIKTKLPKGHSLKERIEELNSLSKTSDNERVKNFIPILVTHYESLSEEDYQGRIKFMELLSTART